MLLLIQVPNYMMELLSLKELLSIKRQRFGKVKGEAHVDGKLVCAGELMFSLVD